MSIVCFKNPRKSIFGFMSVPMFQPEVCGQLKQSGKMPWNKRMNINFQMHLRLSANPAHRMPAGLYQLCIGSQPKYRKTNPQANGHAVKEISKSADIKNRMIR